MTNSSRQMALGAAVAAILALGASSDARPDAASMPVLRQETNLILCRESVRAAAPDRLVIVLRGGCARLAKVFVDLRNEVLDAALDTAGNVAARLKQL